MDHLLAVLAVAIGLLTGGLLFWRWRAGDAGRLTMREALIALRALVLPLLFVVLIGAIFDESHPVAGITVGVVIAAIVVPWLRSGEWGAPATLLRGAGIVALAALIGVALALVFLRPNLPSEEAFDDVGGAPTAIAIWATAVWGLAALLRGLGFARTPLRLLVAVLALFAGARALLGTGALGLTWSHDSFPPTPLALALAGIAFGLCVLLEGVVAELDDPPALLRQLVQPTDQPPQPWAWAPSLRRAGLLAAATATLMLAAAFGVGLWDVKDASTVSTKGLQAADNQQRPLLDYSNSELALAFLPVLRFDEHALWTPQPVDTYLKRASLTRPDNVDEQNGDHPTLDGLPSSCNRRWVDPCWTLTLHCDTAGAADAPCPPSQHHTRSAAPYSDGAVYARVLKAEDGKPNPFQNVGPPGIRGQLRALVQYWFFYTYDEWVAPVLGGRIVQRHEGDWEAVNVGLGADKPLFVAYSEHCGGVWQRWRQSVRVVRTTTPGYRARIAVTGPGVGAGAGPDDWNAARTDLTHPVSYVALGSQANYPPALAGRSPDWSTCQGIPGESVALLSYVWNIRDRTGSDFSWLPEEVKLVDEDTPPMSFPGTWGARDTIEYATAFSEPAKKGGAGPRTPPGQPLWSRPIHRIFCERGWHGELDREDSWQCDR